MCSTLGYRADYDTGKYVRDEDHDVAAAVTPPNAGLTEAAENGKAL
ncbi:hypothetical protein [Curtobacterium sp. CFBP9011]|nr:hypothetical protein [Curtobacterium sp. CFBP9011]MDY1006324.1 hypothetical protein [Curtobacterium sp. CFBP9011]